MPLMESQIHFVYWFHYSPHSCNCRLSYWCDHWCVDYLVLRSWPAGGCNLLLEKSPKPADEEVTAWLLMGWLVGVGSVCSVWLLGWTWSVPCPMSLDMCLDGVGLTPDMPLGLELPGMYLAHDLGMRAPCGGGAAGLI